MMYRWRAVTVLCDPERPSHKFGASVVRVPMGPGASARLRFRCRGTDAVDLTALRPRLLSPLARSDDRSATKG